MKPSPLELRWIRYTEASFKAPATLDESNEPVAVNLAEASVRFAEDGNHVAVMRIENVVDQDYQFHVVVVAVFGLNAEVARAEYKPSNTAGLVPIVAVNMSRILFASAREFLLMITARAPGRGLMLESVLLEPKDIEIASDLEPAEILARVFGAPDEEVAQFRKQWASTLAADQPVSGEGVVSK